MDVILLENYEKISFLAVAEAQVLKPCFHAQFCGPPPKQRNLGIVSRKELTWVN